MSPVICKTLESAVKRFDEDVFLREISRGWVDNDGDGLYDKLADLIQVDDANIREQVYNIFKGRMRELVGVGVKAKKEM